MSRLDKTEVSEFLAFLESLGLRMVWHSENCARCHIVPAEADRVRPEDLITVTIGGPRVRGRLGTVLSLWRGGDWSGSPPWGRQATLMSKHSSWRGIMISVAVVLGYRASGRAGGAGA